MRRSEVIRGIGQAAILPAPNNRAADFMRADNHLDFPENMRKWTVIGVRFCRLAHVQFRPQFPHEILRC